MSFFEVLKFEFKSIFTNIPIVLTIVGGVILYSFFYPQPYINQVVKTLKVSVVDMDRSDISRKIIFNLKATPKLNVIREDLSMNEAKKALLKGEVKGIILIPNNFKKDLSLLKTPTIFLGADANYFLVYGSVVEGALSGILTTKATIKISNLLLEYDMNGIIDKVHKNGTSYKTTLPEDYEDEKVQGKEAIIKCEITNIALKIEDIELNDEIAKDLLKENEIDSSLSPIENLKKIVKKQLEEIKLNDQISNEELHEKVREILLNTIQFEVPENIVEEEMQLWIKREVENMSDEERKKLEENEEEISKLYNRLIDNVVNSVRLTFIIDELAKREKITITDKQVFDFIFYQAVFEQTDPQNMINELRNNRNMFLLLKMKLVELEVINSLLKKRVK